MSARHRQLSAAREWMHDRRCQSEYCHGDNDHARRTQHHFARRVVDGPRVASAVAEAVHEQICLGACRDPQHVALLAEHAEDLVARLDESAIGLRMGG